MCALLDQALRWLMSCRQHARQRSVGSGCRGHGVSRRQSALAADAIEHGRGGSVLRAPVECGADLSSLGLQVFPPFRVVCPPCSSSTGRQVYALQHTRLRCRIRNFWEGRGIDDQEPATQPLRCHLHSRGRRCKELAAQAHENTPACA
jgi:hypothetical protein